MWVSEKVLVMQVPGQSALVRERRVVPRELQEAAGGGPCVTASARGGQGALRAE